MDIEAARTIARETVAETFLAVGVDIRKPGEATEVQRDFAWVRDRRTGLRRFFLAMVVAIASLTGNGIAWAVWNALNKPPVEIVRGKQ